MGFGSLVSLVLNQVCPSSSEYAKNTSKLVFASGVSRTVQDVYSLPST